MFNTILIVCLAFVTAKINANLRKAKYQTPNPVFNRKKYTIIKPKTKFTSSNIEPNIHKVKHSINNTDHSNCQEWTCKEWCLFYEPENEELYSKYGCLEDGDGDACFC